MRESHAIPNCPPLFPTTAANLRTAFCFLGFLLFGLVVIPVIIYKVGIAVFGTYGGEGFGDFYGTLSAKIRAGNPYAWFLVLSPYMGWQSLRALAASWRLTRRLADGAENTLPDGKT